MSSNQFAPFDGQLFPCVRHGEELIPLPGISHCAGEGATFLGVLMVL